MRFFRIFFLFILCACAAPSVGQDIHFTQFYTAPLTLNPSLTGDYSGDFRIANTFRSQWKKFDPGYITNSIAYDQQVYILNEKLSGGLNVVYDKSGVNAMQIAKINLSFAWHKIIKKSVIHTGFQAGYIMKSYDVSKLSFPDQFNHDIGYFDTGLASADDNLNQHASYLDVNAGIGWNHRYGKHTPKFGLAVSHLNRPDESFTDQKNKIPLRTSFTLSDRIDVNEHTSLQPQLLYMEQVKANDFIFGITVTKKTAEQDSKIKSVNYGVYARNSFNSKTDAVALVTGFRYQLFDFGFSYDVNISDAETVTKKHGAFEISIIYTGLNTRALKVKIPCERY